VNSIVLSGANPIVLTGAERSCYRARDALLSHCLLYKSRLRNSSNQKEILRISANWSAPVDHSHTTRIEVRLMPNRLNVWTCFGRTVHEQYLGPIWRALYFAPGSTFGVVQRIENLHATAIHRLLVLRTFESGEITRATGASSGYAQLLRVAGSRKVNLVLALIDAIQDQDIDPADACPDYWRVLHWRLATHRDPHFYTRAEHQFYLDQMVQKP
jgi:hypothetical protein